VGGFQLKRDDFKNRVTLSFCFKACGGLWDFFTRIDNIHPGLRAERYSVKPFMGWFTVRFTVRFKDGKTRVSVAFDFERFSRLRGKLKLGLLDELQDALLAHFDGLCLVHI
jgi:hypothetical protein